jgi:hypothetical protein
LAAAISLKQVSDRIHNAFSAKRSGSFPVFAGRNLKDRPECTYVFEEDAERLWWWNEGLKNYLRQ